MTKVGCIRKIMVLWQAVFLAASPLVMAPPSNLTRLYYNGSAAKSHSTTTQYRQLRRLKTLGRGSRGCREGARGARGARPHPKFFDQNEARRAEKKKIVETGPPSLSQGLDDRTPPLSEGLDPPLRGSIYPPIVPWWGV